MFSFSAFNAFFGFWTAGVQGHSYSLDFSLESFFLFSVSCLSFLSLS
jgi:hypothetical protein